MNDPAKTSFSPFTTPICFPWYVVALFAVPIGWFAFSGLVSDLLVEQTRWMWIRILTGNVLGCFILSWFQRARRKRAGARHESQEAYTAAQPPRDTRFEWLPWGIAFLVVWTILSLLVHGVCRLVGFDIAPISLSATEISIQTGNCTAYLFAIFESQFGAER